MDMFQPVQSLVTIVDTFTRKLKRNIQRTEPPILRMETGTILIVDDNKSVLASLELLLENVFSTVRTAANPNQITTILSTTPIDIVILDMNFSAGINNGNEGLYWLTSLFLFRFLRLSGYWHRFWRL